MLIVAHTKEESNLKHYKYNCH